MTAATILVDKDDSGLAVVTLNRPAAMNALSRQMRRDLTEAVDMLANDPGVRVLIRPGAGRAFCAGLDLKELGAAGSGRSRVKSCASSFWTACRKAL